MKIQFPRSIAYFNYLALLAISLILGGCEKLLDNPLNTPDDMDTRGGDKKSLGGTSRRAVQQEVITIPALKSSVNLHTMALSTPPKTTSPLSVSM